MSENNRVLGARDILDALEKYESECTEAGVQSAVYARAVDRVKNILGAKELTPNQESLVEQFVLISRGELPRKGPGFFRIPTEDRKVNK